LKKWSAFSWYHKALRTIPRRSFFMRKRIVGMTGAALALTCGAAVAHHGWGSYDASKTMVVDSAITRLEWQNPHVHAGMNHDNAEWELVLAPPFRMETRGLNADVLKAGTRVRIEGYSSTRVRNEMRVERITVDGKTFELR
jgi:hypothetical protein